MKLPTLTRPAKPDPTKTYVTVSGFVADCPTMPGWSPRIGTRVKGDSPLATYLWSIGGAHFFALDSADDIELAQAYSRETYGIDATPRPDPTIRTPGPSTHLMISTKPLSIGDSVVPAGSLADINAALVKRFPDAWTEAPASAYTE